MKLSENTINTLKNFSMINSGLLVSEGTLQKTISPEKSVMVEAVFEEHFPRSFAIYDLNRFLGNVTTLNDPEITFEESFLTMDDGSAKMKYFYCDPEIVDSPPNKALSMANPLVTFDLTNAAFSKLLKLANMNGLPNLTVVGTNGEIRLQVHDKANDLSNLADMTLSVYNGPDFTAYFKAEQLKLVQDDYQVTIVQDKFALFAAKNRQIKYYIALLTK